MGLGLAVWLLALGLAWSGTVSAAGDDPPDAGCRACHAGMEPAMPPPGKGPALACTACHLGEGRAKEASDGHAGMAANPAALDQAGRACGPCHLGWPEKVRLSPMATNMGLINQTRWLWGAQEDQTPRYAVAAAPGLEPLPDPAASGQAVDDFLRRRCLRCHLWSPGADLAGARRSAGCAACHRPRDGEGQPPQGHGLTRRVPTSQCLTCHGGGCGAGAAFVGRVARDDDPTARFLEPDPDRPRLIQGRSWRPMRPDLHHQAGLACIDCHTQPEIMGDGVLRPAGLLQVRVRCESCHGRFGAPAKAARDADGRSLGNVLAGPGGLVLRGRVDSRTRAIPALDQGPNAPVAHRIGEHARVACHACHASMNPGDWGWQVLREARPAWEQWSPLAAQGDPQLIQRFAAALALPPGERPPMASRDYLSGREWPGMWLLAPWFRRFEWRVHGQAPDGRTFLLNPRFQYVVTRLDPEGRLVESARIPRRSDGRPGLGLTPWNPHATSRPTLGCASCHGSATALGLGLTFRREDARGRPAGLAPGLWNPGGEGLDLAGDWLRIVDLEGRPAQALLIPGSRPYSAAQLKGLLWPGREYRRWLLRALEQEWPGPMDDRPGPTPHKRR
jgi:hypothetical protein